MVNKKVVKHPQTGEELTITEWSAKLGIPRWRLYDRIKINNGDLVRALDPNYKRPGSWTKDEEEFLALIYKTPGWYNVWRNHARKSGWCDRSEDALRAKLTDLQQRGLVGKKRKIEKDDGWTTVTALSNCLGISHSDVISRWIKNCNLTAYRDGDNPKSPIKIHLKHFVDWATSDDGYGEIAKAVNGNKLAIAWLMRAIGLWILEDYPQVGIKRIVCDRTTS